MRRQGLEVVLVLGRPSGLVQEFHLKHVLSPNGRMVVSDGITRIDKLYLLLYHEHEECSLSRRGDHVLHLTTARLGAGSHFHVYMSEPFRALRAE